MRKTNYNYIGKTFGKLVVESRDEDKKTGKNLSTAIATWRCRCECGNTVIVDSQQLRKTRHLTCGCGKPKYAPKDYRQEYNSWQGMKERCYKKDSHKYEDYGGRGITICDRWRNSFDNFIDDMGRRPSKDMSIDRINNDGNYEPNNCRWATDEEQMRNRRDQIGQTSKYNGVSYEKVLQKWRAEIFSDDKKTYLGLYESEIDAYKARLNGEIKYWGRICSDTHDIDISDIDSPSYTYSPPKRRSKYKGVYYNKVSNTWYAQVHINGKNKTVASSKDEDIAHNLRQEYLNKLNEKEAI